jgi:hypothetical protein
MEFYRILYFWSNNFRKRENKQLLVSKIKGTVLLTGSEFGPEGSLQATYLSYWCDYIIGLSHKENKIIKPYWKLPKFNNQLSKMIA